MARTGNPPYTDTRKAREAHQHYAAVRAVDDPVKLARAARIVRVALERNRISLADLTRGDSDAA